MRRSSSRPINTFVLVLLLSIAPWTQAASLRGHRKLLTWGVGGLGWGGGGGAQWCGPVMQMVNYRCVPGGGLVQPAYGGGGGPYYGGGGPPRNGNGGGNSDTACSTSTARAANGATTTTTSCAGADSATSTSSGTSGR